MTNPCPECAAREQWEADNPRPWRCGAFNTATGNQCVLESDHSWRHIMSDDLITPEEAIVLVKAAACVKNLVHSTDPTLRALAKAVADMQEAK